MIKKIGVENFRVFKEFTEFEIKPLTLLVGPNNAGKSSFTKLLLLLKNGVSKLNFEDGSHNLGGFDNVLNWESENKYLKIRFDSKIDFLDEYFFINATYKSTNGEVKLVAIDLKNKDESLLTCAIPFNKDSGFRVFNLNIKLLTSLLYFNKVTSFSEIDDNREVYTEEFEHTIYSGDLSIENYNRIYEESEGLDFRNIGKIVLKHEIKKLEKDHLLYDIFIKGKKVTSDYKDKILELQEFQIPNIYTDFDFNEFDFNEYLKGLIDVANEFVKNKILFYFKELLQEKDTTIKETRLGRLLFTEKLFEPSDLNISLNDDSLDNKTINYKKTFFQQFGNFSKGLAEDFKSIEYISANRGSQKRILNNDSENDIDKIILEFSKKSDKNILYLEKIFKLLEISGTITVERIENVISVVYLMINNKKVALSDVGFGYSQLIPIILKIATVTTSEYTFPQLNSEEEWKMQKAFSNNNKQKILIIEEPEANLHPSLQSKLADMLVATIEFYPYINFIIETHSEYLIRKLQFLTASKKVGTDKSIIYYFNADKYVTATEPKVKPIEIRENGNLSDTFGPGFYDETTRLQFDLMKLNQEQHN